MYEIGQEHRPAIINFSGGRSSGFMLYHIMNHYNFDLPDDIKVVFSNTGKEFDETLDFVHECSIQWNIDIKYIEYVFNSDAEGGVKDPKHTYKVVSYEEASRDGRPFQALIDASGRIPSTIRRLCTKYLKVRPTEMYVKRGLGWKNHTSILGIRYDEPQRIKTTLMEMCRVEYPLYHNRVSLRDIETFWDNHYFDLKIPSYLSNCDMCFLKKKNALMRINKDFPDRIGWWIENEENNRQRLIDKDGFAGVAAQFNKVISYQEIQEVSESRLELFDDFDEPLSGIDCFCGD